MGIRFIKFEPTNYVLKVRNGAVVNKGVGLSFFYDTMTSSIISVPTTSFDTSFAFGDIMTTDFQQITVQGEVTYLIENYEQAAKVVDFTFCNTKAENVEKRRVAKERLDKFVMKLTKVAVMKFFSDRDLRKSIAAGTELTEKMNVDLKQDDAIKEYGIRITSVSILGILATVETRKALEAAAREEILKEQDDAIYKRRNAAIEQERLVKENELNTEIKVEIKEKEKKEAELDKEQFTQRKCAEMEKEKVQSDSEIQSMKMQNDTKLETERKNLVLLEADNEKRKADVKAYEYAAVLKALDGVNIEIIKALAMSGMDSKTLIAKAFTDLGVNAEKIGTLNVTPDLLEKLMENR